MRVVFGTAAVAAFLMMPVPGLASGLDNQAVVQIWSNVGHYTAHQASVAVDDPACSLVGDQPVGPPFLGGHPVPGVLLDHPHPSMTVPLPPSVAPGVCGASTFQVQLENRFVIKVTTGNTLGVVDPGTSSAKACLMAPGTKIHHEPGTVSVIRSILEGRQTGRCVDLWDHMDWLGETPHGYNSSGIVSSHFPGIPLSLFGTDYGLWSFCIDVGFTNTTTPRQASDVGFIWFDGTEGALPLSHAGSWANPWNWDRGGAGQPCPSDSPRA